MDINLRRDINKWLATASDEQLQAKLLKLDNLVTYTFTESPVIEDAKAILRMIESEIAIRPHAKFLAENLPYED